jgi:hypothetical protein
LVVASVVVVVGASVTGTSATVVAVLVVVEAAEVAVVVAAALVPNLVQLTSGPTAIQASARANQPLRTIPRLSGTSFGEADGARPAAFLEAIDPVEPPGPVDEEGSSGGKCPSPRFKRLASPVIDAPTGDAGS